MNIEKSTITRNSDVQQHKQAILARARTMSAGIRLVLCQIDEIGIMLSADLITPEHAAHDLWLLEQLPVFVAALFLSGDGA